jgi:hypothetical protein
VVPAASAAAPGVVSAAAGPDASARDDLVRCDMECRDRARASVGLDIWYDVPRWRRAGAARAGTYWGPELYWPLMGRFRIVPIGLPGRTERGGERSSLGEDWGNQSSRV